uniref:Uncharacterized protein n=1 Tax=Oryza glumipatula TaxID=40148 RepID=A0A0D9YNF2_9ORYZ
MYDAVACVVAVVVVVVFAMLRVKLARSGGGGGGGGGGVRLPPGPWRLPVIGSLHHVVGDRLLHRAMARIARRLGDAPLVYLQLGVLGCRVGMRKMGSVEPTIGQPNRVAKFGQPDSLAIRSRGCWSTFFG